MQEVWKDYHGYKISSHGKVIGLRGQELKPHPNSKGYLRVLLTIGDWVRWHRVHRLVATLFLKNDNPQHCKQVDHINGDKADNRASNLRWVSDSQNKLAKYGLRRLLGKPTLTDAEQIAIAKARAARRYGRVA